MKGFPKTVIESRFPAISRGLFNCIHLGEYMALSGSGSTPTGAETSSCRAAITFVIHVAGINLPALDAAIIRSKYPVCGDVTNAHNAEGEASAASTACMFAPQVCSFVGWQGCLLCCARAPATRISRANTIGFIWEIMFLR